MKKLILLFLFATLMFFSCKKDSGNDLSGSSLIPFLKVGNYWVYDFRNILYVSQVRIEIVEQINSETFNIEITQTVAGDTIVSEQEWKIEEGYLKTRNEGDQLQNPIYKIDSKLGDSWNYESASQGTITHTVIATDSIINTMEGSYECIVYRRQATGIANDSYLFWNKNAGEILEDAGSFASIELNENSVMEGSQGLFTSLLITVEDLNTEDSIPEADVYLLDDYLEFPDAGYAIHDKMTNLQGEVFFGDLESQQYFVRVNDWDYDNSHLDSIYFSTRELIANQMNLFTAYAEAFKKKGQEQCESKFSGIGGVSLFGLEE